MGKPDDFRTGFAGRVAAAARSEAANGRAGFAGRAGRRAATQAYACCLKRNEVASAQGPTYTLLVPGGAPA